jgi:hypothetical protein
MTFARDIHSTRVRNSLFDNPKFSVDLRPAYLIFCLFERVYLVPVPDRVVFLKFLLSCEIERCLKIAFSCIEVLLYKIKTKVN